VAAPVCDVSSSPRNQTSPARLWDPLSLGVRSRKTMKIVFRAPHRQLNCGACTLDQNFPVRRRNFPVTRLEFPCFALQGIRLSPLNFHVDRTRGGRQKVQIRENSRYYGANATSGLMGTLPDSAHGRTSRCYSLKSQASRNQRACSRPRAQAGTPSGEPCKYRRHDPAIRARAKPRQHPAKADLSADTLFRQGRTVPSHPFRPTGSQRQAHDDGGYHQHRPDRQGIPHWRGGTIGSRDRNGAHGPAAAQQARDDRQVGN
jgi:hypothetical protein